MNVLGNILKVKFLRKAIDLWNSWQLSPQITSYTVAMTMLCMAVLFLKTPPTGMPYKELNLYLPQVAYNLSLW